MSCLILLLLTLSQLDARPPTEADTRPLTLADLWAAEMDTSLGEVEALAPITAENLSERSRERRAPAATLDATHVEAVAPGDRGQYGVSSTRHKGGGVEVGQCTWISASRGSTSCSSVRLSKFSKPTSTSGVISIQIKLGETRWASGPSLPSGPVLWGGPHRGSESLLTLPATVAAARVRLSSR